MAELDTTTVTYETPTPISAVDTAPMMGVYYTGPYRYAKITITTTVPGTAGLVLNADDTDGETTNALTLDLTSAAYNTFGEVVDGINALNSTGWFAFLIGARRADLTYNAATFITIIAQAEISCKNTVIKLLNASTIATAGTAFVQPYGITSGEVGQCDEGRQVLLSGFNFTVTYASGSNTIQVYFCDDAAKTDYLAYSVAGGATTVALAKDEGDWGGHQPLAAPVGNRMIVRAVTTVTATAPNLEVRRAIVSVGPVTIKPWIYPCEV
jgi:hypothetical protein